jgi:catechol 2,3-dioxygenase-like lactoylglutathione lyase family enzyme
MLLKHVALVCGSEKNSDKFYRDLLGLEKQNPKILSRALSQQIFNDDAEYKIINYMAGGVHVEIFLSDHGVQDRTKIAHICLEVANLPEFLQKCHSMGIHVRQIPKGEGSIIFIADFDGNLFEIKESIRRT